MLAGWSEAGGIVGETEWPLVLARRGASCRCRARAPRNSSRSICARGRSMARASPPPPCIVHAARSAWVSRRISSTSSSEGSPCGIVSFGLSPSPGWRGLSAASLLILLADPLGVSPIGIVRRSPAIAVSDRRFDAPQIIASGKIQFVPGRHLDHASGRSRMGEGCLRRTLRHRRHSRRHAVRDRPR